VKGAPGKHDGGRSLYDASDYFTGRGAHLLDPESDFHRYRVRKVLQACGSLREARAVDLGCGWGTLSFALAGEAGKVIGVDFSSEALRLCNERLAREPHANLSFLQADATRTGLKGEAFDLVVAADLVEHIDPETTLRLYREGYRLLRPGGRFVLWTPNPQHILEWLRRQGVLKEDPTHIDYKTLPRVTRELEACGFVVTQATYVESHLPVLRGFERLFQRFVPALRRRISVTARRP